jgi:small subunit ribosomal protein S4
MYGLLERQFVIIFKRASRSKGVTGVRLLQLLESRLDNVIYRLGVAQSIYSARQAVSHGCTFVNGRKVNIGSYTLKPGDVIDIKGKEGKLKLLRNNIELLQDRAAPPWIEFDPKALKARILRLPDREDIQFPIQEQMIVELYSK